MTIAVQNPPSSTRVAAGAVGLANGGESDMKRRAAKPSGYLRFAEYGFGDRITAVLIKAGIGAPERLLSMAPERIRLLQGIGPTLMKEIEQYRARAKVGATGAI